MLCNQQSLPRTVWNDVSDSFEEEIWWKYREATNSVGATDSRRSGNVDKKQRQQTHAEPASYRKDYC